jgi:purine-binding chemotaxis protein CheW
MHQADLKQAQAAFKEGLRGDKTYTRFYRILTKEGQLKWVLELAQIHCDDQGQIDHVSGSLLDVTEEILDQQAQERSERLTGRYLIVSLGGVEYGLDILRIKEITGMAPITPMHGLPSYVRGVINLRGKVIPVLDLRLLFAIEPSSNEERTCIVILETGNGNGKTLTGAVVDSVSQVLQIKGAEVSEVDRASLGMQAPFLLGIARQDSMLRILLDAERLVAHSHLIADAQSDPSLPPA